MQRILGHLEFVVVCLDDILIFSDNEEAQRHETHLRQVLQILRENQLYASKEKSEFFTKQISFLGHEILEGGFVIKPNLEKIQAISDWLAPKNLKELQSFPRVCKLLSQVHIRCIKKSSTLIPVTLEGMYLGLDIGM
jgi:hypothetical protein